jgi:hypothetical protein
LSDNWACAIAQAFFFEHLGSGHEAGFGLRPSLAAAQGVFAVFDRGEARGDSSRPGSSSVIVTRSTGTAHRLN